MSDLRRAISRARARIAALTVMMIAWSMSFDDAHASAPRLPPRERADALAPGQWQVGLTSPTRIGLGGQRELTSFAAGWLVLVPNVALRQSLRSPQHIWQTRGEFGLSFPGYGYRLSQGYLLPAQERSGGHPGHFLVPRFGWAVSYGYRNIVATKVELAYGIGLDTRRRPPSLDTYAPIELLYAPVVDIFRAQLALSGDFALHERARVRPSVRLWFIGPLPADRSPVILDTRLALDYALSHRVFLSVGGAWYNSDQHRQRLIKKSDGSSERQRIRSNDFFPSIDLVVRSKR
jgi:hypothetical protein